jgi:hypothetical protein
VHLALAARLRVGQHHGADLRQVHVPRVEHLDRDQLVPGGQATQRPLPVDVAEEVGDHHGEAAAAGRSAQLFQRVPQVAPDTLRRAGGLGDLADQATGVREPTAGRDAGDLLAGGDDRADTVAAATGEVHDRGDRGHHEVTLLARGGAEVQARGQVDHDPGLELAVGDGLADVRHGRARGDGPVHAAHVVTRLVGAGLPRFGTGAGHQAEVVALQEPVEPAAHVQLEQPHPVLHPIPLKDRRRPGRPLLLATHLPATPTGGGWTPPDCGRAETCGNGTVCSTREMMWSIGTPSASAS